MALQVVEDDRDFAGAIQIQVLRHRIRAFEDQQAMGDVIPIQIARGQGFARSSPANLRRTTHERSPTVGQTLPQHQIVKPGRLSHASLTWKIRTILRLV